MRPFSLSTPLQCLVICNRFYNIFKLSAVERTHIIHFEIFRTLLYLSLQFNSHTHIFAIASLMSVSTPILPKNCVSALCTSSYCCGRRKGRVSRILFMSHVFTDILSACLCASRFSSIVAFTLLRNFSLL